MEKTMGLDAATGPQNQQELVKAADHALSIAYNVTFTETGLEFPRTVDRSQWQSMGGAVFRFDQSCKWAIGDWVNYGRRRFGEESEQIIDDCAAKFGRARSSIERFAWVADSIEQKERKRNLTFTHYQAVASLDSDTAARILDMAVDNGLTSRETADAAKQAKEAVAQADQGQTTIILTPPSITKISRSIKSMSTLAEIYLNQPMPNLRGYKDEIRVDEVERALDILGRIKEQLKGRL